MTKIFDSEGYITQTIEYDETEDCYIVGSHQNIQLVMDDLHERNTDGTGGFSKSRDLRHMAKIPMALYDEWLREAYVQNIPVYHKAERDTFVKRKLADHRKLEVKGKASGRLGFEGHNSYWPTG